MIIVPFPTPCPQRPVCQPCRVESSWHFTHSSQYSLEDILFGRDDIIATHSLRAVNAVMRELNQGGITVRQLARVTVAHNSYSDASCKFDPRDTTCFLTQLQDGNIYGLKPEYGFVMTGPGIQRLVESGVLQKENVLRDVFVFVTGGWTVHCLLKIYLSKQGRDSFRDDPPTRYC